MTHASIRNCACAIGLFVGVGLIASVDVSAAEMRTCTADERSQLQVVEDVPVLCEVMTVTAAPQKTVAERLRSFDYTALFSPRESLREEISTSLPDWNEIWHANL